MGILLSLLIIVYFMACLFLIVVILGQEGKGGGLSGLVGASALGETLGASAAESTLRRWTRNAAIAFVVLSLFLTILGSRVFRGSILDDAALTPVEQPLATEPAPTTPTVQQAPAVTPAVVAPTPSGPAIKAPEGETPAAPAPTPAAPAPTPAAIQPTAPAPKPTPAPAPVSEEKPTTPPA